MIQQSHFYTYTTKRNEKQDFKELCAPHVYDSQDTETVSIHHLMNKDGTHTHTHTHACMHTNTQENYSATRKKEILAISNNTDEHCRHYAKWNKPDRETVYDLTKCGFQKKAESTNSRVMVTRLWVWMNSEDVGQRTQSPIYKMSKFWWSNV